MDFHKSLAAVCVCLSSFGLAGHAASFDSIKKYDNVWDLDAARERSVASAPSIKGGFLSASTSKDGAVLPEDRQVYDAVAQYAIAEALHQQPFGEAVQLLAEYFQGIPYRGYQLDQSAEERLVVTFQSFDCVLFVETAIALARAFSLQEYSLDVVLDNIQGQRYRNAEIDGYCSRLHYFTDWIQDNQRRGIVTDITPQLGGIVLPKAIDFMTSHRESYPQLISNEENYRCISNMEKTLSPLDITYIPTENISAIYPELRSGDIIAIATSIPGLDVSHTSLVRISDEGAVGVIHSDVYGVKTEPDLQAFVANAKHSIGIIVARPNDSRE